MRVKSFYRLFLPVLALLMIAGCAPSENKPGDPFQDPAVSDALEAGAKSLPLAAPEYPEFLSYEDWEESHARREELSDSLLSSMRDFSADTAGRLMQNSGKNTLYSPTSLYFALSMLAQSSGGNTREEALTLLHTDLNALRSGLGAIYRSLYCDNEYCRRQVANSLWLPLDEAFKAKDETLRILASDYYTELYQTDFGTRQSALDISEWIANKTGGKLGGDAGDFVTAPYPDTAMILYNTLYYKDEWIDRFNEEKTAPAEFTTASGDSIPCDFMNRTYASHGMGYAKDYSSITIGLKEGHMRFLLPDEGVSPYDILQDAELMRAILSGNDEIDDFYGEVVFSLPKFDYKDEIDLAASLKALGLTDAFDREHADFSPISDNRPLFISSVRQQSTIAIDENGVEAAAFTEIAYAGAGMPEGRGEMILNRPFLYILYANNGLPLFIGVVNNPAA